MDQLLTDANFLTNRDCHSGIASNGIVKINILFRLSLHHTSQKGRRGQLPLSYLTCCRGRDSSEALSFLPPPAKRLKPRTKRTRKPIPPMIQTLFLFLNNFGLIFFRISLSFLLYHINKTIAILLTLSVNGLRLHP